MHHEEGIRTLDPWTVKTTAGTYKTADKGSSLPQWKLPDGRGLLLRQSKFINMLFLLH